VLPFLAIIGGGVIYYLLFPGKFDLSMSWARESGRISGEMAGESWVFVLSQKLSSGFIQVLWLVFLIFGEEFGWRAYLLPKLMPLGTRKAFLLVGIIWAVFHWPMIFLGFQYGTGYWGAPVSGSLLFALIIMSPSVLYSWLTLRTGSVWPATIGHTIHNTFCTLMLLFHMGDANPLIGPEPEGIVGCLGYVLLVLLMVFFVRPFAQPASAAVADPGQINASKIAVD
jgi:membrane protease YdiL (CAAX protease family)